jgi:pimeloyl-ACP methyl ester carboxylesterase
MFELCLYTMWIVIKFQHMRQVFLLAVACMLAVAASAQQDPVPPGRLIDMGGYRLHIDVKGQGSPTVVLIAGSQAFSIDWALVMPEVAKFTRVCSYDRPGLAWSDPGPMPQTFDQDVYELHTLLQKAGILPPYIFVGHSLGGIIARWYEKKYPKEVKGLVLVDATSEDTKLFMNGKIQQMRLLSQNRPIPPVKTHPDTLTKVPSGQELEAMRKAWGEPKTEAPFDLLPARQQQERLWAQRQPKIYIADSYPYLAEEFSMLYADSLYSLGAKPLYVLSSGLSAFSPHEDSAMRAIWLEKLEQKEKMSHLSTNSKHLITTRSRHEIHLDEPELVIRAIRDVVEAVRSGKQLR